MQIIMAEKSKTTLERIFYDADRDTDPTHWNSPILTAAQDTRVWFNSQLN